MKVSKDELNSNGFRNKPPKHKYVYLNDIGALDNNIIYIFLQDEDENGLMKVSRVDINDVCHVCSISIDHPNFYNLDEMISFLKKQFGMIKKKRGTWD